MKVYRTVRDTKEYTTREMIQDALTMPILHCVYKTQWNNATFRLYRSHEEEWIAQVHSTIRPVSNNDEKCYSRPSYIRGFLERHITFPFPNDYMGLKWTKDTDVLEEADID